jgi:hypothetical protein
VRRNALLVLVVIAAAMTIIWVPRASTAPSGSSACGACYAPVLDPANFVSVIDNRYFPLPVGRTLVYTGIKDGQSQTDTVTVTNQTKIILGITATLVSDVATVGTNVNTVLEKTFDYYAQDKQGTVWYLGEDTTAFLSNGKTDTSGSFLGRSRRRATRHHHGGESADSRRLPSGVCRWPSGGHRVGGGNDKLYQRSVWKGAERSHDA